MTIFEVPKIEMTQARYEKLLQAEQRAEQYKRALENLGRDDEIMRDYVNEIIYIIENSPENTEACEERKE